MNESALKALIDALQASRASLDPWLTLFTSMVVIGVVLEVVFVVREYYLDLGDWRRGILHPPDRPSRLWTLFELFGVALVAIGVAGELFIDVRAGSLETQIRKANEQLVLLLEKEAGDAGRSAKTAHDEANSVSNEVDALDTRINLASSKLDILEGRLAWRTISPGQSRRAKKELTRFKGSSVVIISASPLGNPEPPAYAKQVAKVFTDSGWSVDLEPRRTRSYSPPGIECRGKNTAAGVAAEKFCESLPDVGFKSSQLQLDAPYAEQIIIREKPSP